LDIYHPHIVLPRARIWGSVVVFRSQKGPRAKQFGKHWYRKLTQLH